MAEEAVRLVAPGMIILPAALKNGRSADVFNRNDSPVC
jgi:hypothetical protein